MFYSIIQEKCRQWLALPECPVTPVLQYIRQRGALRETQIAAIETYLYLKIAGRGRPLAWLFAEGFFNQPVDFSRARMSQVARERFEADPAALALFQLCESIDGQSKGRRTNALAETFERHLTEHPADRSFTDAFDEIFYNASYPDYLFSLPMGAGKTFLMAAFIYLDLHFAVNEPDNPAFARNFIVLAPSGLKSSIVPSLRTIEHFDPTWVLPEPAASDMRKLVKFEVLDQPKTAKKSNRARNPNAQKVAAHQPFEDLTGLVLVVNAEKVILDRVELDDNLQLIERNEEEKERFANELRHLIGTIPRMQIFIDEVQRAARGDIKLRAVVNGWCRAGQQNTVLGFSGTPYHSAPRLIEVGPVKIRSATIANTVYYYPLATAVADFLKKPRLEVASGLKPIEIVRTGVQRFLRDYGAKTYANGACAKLAVYCGTIARLEEEIHPMLVGELGIPPERILRYHQGNRTHRAPPNAAADFALLDDPASRRQIILLVQIGKEGWDCRSLTGVILSQEGDCPRNMVLQTSCRCLRQVDGGPGETALILLNEANAAILDRQLGEEQNTSIAELNAIQAAGDEPLVAQVSRMEHLKLPPVDFYQLRIRYDVQQLETAPDTPARLAALNPDTPAFRTRATITTRYLDERHAAAAGALSVNRETATVYDQYGGLASFPAWLNDIVHEGLGTPRAADLRPYHDVLRDLFHRVTYIHGGLRRYNTLYDQCQVRSEVRMAFRVRRQLLTTEEVVRENAALLLVDKLHAIPEHSALWPKQEKRNDILRMDADPAAAARADPALIERKKAEFRQTAEDFNNPELADMWIRDLLESEARRAEAAADRDRTLHYLPYDFRQSDFERKFLEGALALAEIRTAGLELYYNGDRALTSFKIDCYARIGGGWRRVGFYTPDFLLIRRDASRDIRQILILETKGRGYAGESGFVARRHFMENEFIRLNNEKFGYRRFDYLLLFDDSDLASNLEQLADRIRTFFTEA
ncbi:MAG: hypothetical protein ACOX9C_06770 [Kiritimatiellia bacterium]|jgi:type III restriction enzyme